MKYNLANVLFLFFLCVICTAAACDLLETSKLTILFTGDASGNIEPCG